MEFFLKYLSLFILGDFFNKGEIMKDIKNKLIELRDSLSEETFNIDEFLIDIHGLAEQSNQIDLYKNFRYIVEVEEAKTYELEDDILDFVDTVDSNKYIDIKNLVVLDYSDIIKKIDAVINSI